MKTYSKPMIHVVKLDNETVLAGSTPVEINNDPITNGNQIAAKNNFDDWDDEEDEY